MEENRKVEIRKMFGIRGSEGYQGNSSLILGTEYELRNRYLHVDYVDGNSQSVSYKFPKSQFDTLKCNLEELAVL